MGLFRLALQGHGTGKSRGPAEPNVGLAMKVCATSASLGKATVRVVSLRG